LSCQVEEKYFLSAKTEKYVMSGGTLNYKLKPEINPTKAFPLTATMAKMHRAGIDTYVKTGIIKELMITHIKI
jgi:DNA (cytosine-5)-methyltransferase 1